MKNFLMVIVLLGTAFLSLQAQKNLVDVVYLKNGSIIRGSITEIVPDSIVKMEMAGGSMLIFKSNEVKLISKEAVQKKERIKNVSLSRGYRFGFDGGWIFASSDNNNKSPFSIHIINHYHVFSSTAVGIGGGIEFFDITQAPLFLDLRQYLNRKSYAVYLFVQGGALFPVGPNHYQRYGYLTKGKEGYMVNPGLGFLFPLGERAGMTVSISYRYQEMKSVIEDYYKTDYRLTEKMNRVNLRIGFMLH